VQYWCVDPTEFREGLRTPLELVDDAEIAGEASTREEAISLAAAREPDVNADCVPVADPRFRRDQSVANSLLFNRSDEVVSDTAQYRGLALNQVCCRRANLIH
jgi:hypothetical protein